MINLCPMEPLVWRTVVARCLLGSTVKLVAYTLANYASKDGSSVRPGVALIVKDTELGDRTVRDALEKLREVGLIERTFHASPTGLRDKADEYRLTFPEDLEERIAMWDPKRRKLTRGGVEVAPPKPRTRQKRAKAPATPAGGSAGENGEPPASDAGGSTSESDETGHENGSVQGATAGNHRQLLPEPPATDTKTTGRSCHPPSQAPSQAPSHNSNTSGHFGSEEGEAVERREPSADRDHHSHSPPAVDYAAASGYLARYPDCGSAFMSAARQQLGEGTPLATLVIHAYHLALGRPA